MKNYIIKNSEVIQEKLGSYFYDKPINDDKHLSNISKNFKEFKGPYNNQFDTKNTSFVRSTILDNIDVPKKEDTKEYIKVNK